MNRENDVTIEIFSLVGFRFRAAGQLSAWTFHAEAARKRCAEVGTSPRSGWQAAGLRRVRATWGADGGARGGDREQARVLLADSLGTEGAWQQYLPQSPPA